MSGLILNMPRSDYEKVQAMNFSTLKNGLESMRQLKWSIGHPKERTDDMLVGCAWHLAVFEPGDFDKRIKVFEGKTRRGAEWDAVELAASKINGYALTLKQHDLVLSMAQCLTENAQARSLLQCQGKGEQTIQWIDLETGITLKGIIDRLCTVEYSGLSQPFVIDGKTTASLDERSIKQIVIENAYHMQAAMYLDGLNTIAECPRRFAWIFQEKEPSFDAVVYEPSDDLLALGRQQYRRLLKEYSECLHANKWPGRQNLSESDAITILETPTWATK